MFLYYLKAENISEMESDTPQNQKAKQKEVEYNQDQGCEL